MTKKILVIDDEPAITRLVKLNLERTGNYEVRTENHGSLAITAARQFKPDLILLDVIMPDMDGDEVSSQLRDAPDLADIKIVFLTAIVTRDETQAGSLIGGYQFLAKPVLTKELIEMIEKVLANGSPAG